MYYNKKITKTPLLEERASGELIRGPSKLPDQCARVLARWATAAYYVV